METRANFVLIGAFTLAVIAGAFLFVMWFAGVAKLGAHQPYRVLFTGSVSGLSSGAPVLFNGLKVGEVARIDFDRNDPGRVVATIDVDARAPIKKDTKARLEQLGLTGAAAVALMGGAADAPPLVAEGGGPPVIIAEPSQFQNLLESAQRLSAHADSMIAKADKILTDNGPAIDSTLANIASFSKALGDSSSGINVALTSLSDLGKKIGPLTQKLETLSDDVDGLVKAVDPAKVRSAVGNIESFSSALADSKSSYKSLVDDAASLAKRLNESSTRLDSALAGFDKLVKAVNPDKVAGLVEAIDPAKVRSAIDNIESFSGALSDSKASYRSLVDDAASLAKRLNDTSGRLDSALDGLDKLVKAVNPEKVAGVVDAFDPGKVRSAIDNINAFTGALSQSKESYKSLIEDAASLAKRLNDSSTRLDTALADFDALMKSADPKKVSSLVDSVTDFAATLRENRGNVDRTLKDFAELSAKLNESADKVDGLMTSLQNVIGSPDTKGALAQVGDAAQSVRKLADDIDARVKDVAGGLTRFSSTGLREFEALAVDGRRAVNDIDRLVRGLEKNPSQVIFGPKSTLPEYHGGP